jgi:hypothetical protein
MFLTYKLDKFLVHQNHSILNILKKFLQMNFEFVHNRQHSQQIFTNKYIILAGNLKKNNYKLLFIIKKMFSLFSQN